MLQQFFFSSSFPTSSCRKLYFYKLFYPIINDFDNFRNLGNNLMVLSELKKLYSQKNILLKFGISFIICTYFVLFVLL